MPTIDSNVEHVGGAIPASGGGGGSSYVNVDPAPTLLKNQSVSASASPAVTFDQAPNAGDLIFVTGSLAGPRVVSNPTDGFVIVDQHLAGSHAAVTFAKKAVGNETGFSFDVNSSSVFRYHAVSYDGAKLDVDKFLANLAAYTDKDTSNSSSATKNQASGSVSISETKGIAIASFVPDTFTAIDGSFSYTNGYAQEYAAGDAWTGVIVATKALAQAGATNSTFSTDAAGSGDQVVGLLAVIPAAEAPSSGASISGPASITVNENEAFQADFTCSGDGGNPTLSGETTGLTLTNVSGDQWRIASAGLNFEADPSRAVVITQPDSLGNATHAFTVTLLDVDESGGTPQQEAGSGPMILVKAADGTWRSRV